MTVRGTRIALEILTCLDLPMDPDAVKDTLISAIDIFHARLAAHGDGLIYPDPWLAPIVEGVDCGLAVKSNQGQRTMKYQVAVDALLGMFKFYTTIKVYASSLAIVRDKSLAEPDWEVGIVVVGPFDLHQ